MKVSNVSFNGIFVTKSAIRAGKFLADESVRHGAKSLLERNTYGFAVRLENVGDSYGGMDRSAVLCATGEEASSLHSAIMNIRNGKLVKESLNTIDELINKAQTLD